MDQIISHHICVKFYDPFNTVDHVQHYNTADIQTSRNCGREIAVWLCKGAGYRVDSETIAIIRVPKK